MQDNDKVLQEINAAFSIRFSDYVGAYLYGSRVTGNAHDGSDYDVVLVFGTLDYAKEMAIAGLISDISYRLNIFLDCKLFASQGKKSIEYFRTHVNPVFISRAIDSGVYYARK